MEFIIELNDSLSEKPIKDEVARVVNQMVNNIVREKLLEHRTTIERAVELHLAKRLTDKDIKNEIEAATKRIIENQLS